jgi:CRP-like cAMP-binding protein
MQILTSASRKSRKIFSLLMRHEQAMFGQAQQLAACNIAHNVEERLARWLMRARDLSGSDTLPLTQKLLAQKLGVRKTSVSLVAHAFQHAGVMKYSRGKIVITDADRLAATACECYSTVNGLYARLFAKR